MGIKVDNDYIKQLEERIYQLEQKLSSLSLNEAKEIVIHNSQVSNLNVGDECKIDFHHCPIGTVVDADIDDADSRLDDLESRLDEINSQIDEAESKLDETI